MSTTIVELLRARAEANPTNDACKVRIKKGRWRGISWRERLADAEAVAQFFHKHEVAKGCRVAILGSSNADWQLIEWSILLAGGVVVGIDPTAPRDMISEMFETTSPTVVVALTRADADQFDSLIPSMCQLRLIAQEDSRSLPNWKKISKQPSDPIIPLPSVDPEDSATIIFTSGTSGKPKAIGYSHRQIMVACDAIAQEMPIVREADHVLSWLPLQHLFQRMMNLVAAKCGAIVHFVENPREIIACAKEVTPKVFVGVPRFYEKMLEEIRFQAASQPRLIELAVLRILDGDEKESSLLLRGLQYIVRRRLRRTLGHRMQYLISGSAPLALKTSQQLERIGWGLLEAYGVSENAVPLALNRPGQRRLGSVGQPLDVNELRIEIDGEILVRGPGLFEGYLRDDNACLTSEGFYRTGDLGSFDDDGYLYLHGRKSQMIKTSTGRKIFPATIEAVYQQHALLESVVVFGDARKFLIALIVPSRRELERRLPKNFTYAENEIDNCREIYECLRQAVTEQESLLAPHERVARFAVMERPFNVEHGELTTNLKLRRQMIAKKYGETLEQLYQNDAEQSLAIVEGVA